MNWLKLIVIASITSLTVFLGTSFSPGQAGEDGLIIDADEAVFSRTEIVLVGNAIFRFDTATGELFRFTGTRQGPNANGKFMNIAPPVADETSGFLEITRVDNATFLIDVVTGDTWVLRQSSANNAAWIPVNTFG